MKVREVLDAARDAALEIRRIDEEAEVRRQSIGVQGHNSFEFHSKAGILDPSRKIDELLDWQSEMVEESDLLKPIDEAWVIVCGMQKVTDDFTVEIITRYYLQAESWREIVIGNKAMGIAPMSDRRESWRDLSCGDQEKLLAKSVSCTISKLEEIGIAHLKEMGQL